MQIDSPTIRRLRDMLLKEAGLPPHGNGEVRFDAEAPETQALVLRVSPMCEVLYLVMTADGESDARELQTIRGAIRSLTGDGLPSETIGSMLAQFSRAAVAQGREQRLMQVATQLSADREDAEAALALAAAVSVADDLVDPSEESLIVELGEWLGISPRRAAVILDTRMS